MSEFTPITTQEEFDSAIKARIERERRTITEKYSDYEDLKNKVGGFEKQISDLNGALDSANKKIATYDDEIAKRDAIIKQHESHSAKTRIAHEVGLSYDAIDFLRGDDEDSIRQSAESLKALVGKSHSAPLASQEPAGINDASDKDAYKNLLKNIKGE